jgi:RNA recognition motif-containing protein
MNTRLFVNNIPRYVDNDRLREHFGTQGDVTDVRVLRTKCGLPDKNCHCQAGKHACRRVAKSEVV